MTKDDYLEGFSKGEKETRTECINWGVYSFTMEALGTFIKGFKIRELNVKVLIIVRLRVSYYYNFYFSLREIRIM